MLLRWVVTHSKEKKNSEHLHFLIIINPFKVPINSRFKLKILTNDTSMSILKFKWIRKEMDNYPVCTNYDFQLVYSRFN